MNAFLPAPLDHAARIAHGHVSERRAPAPATSVRAPAPGRCTVVICRAGRELGLTFARHHRRWGLTDIQLTVDGNRVRAGGNGLPLSGGGWCHGG
jgi:hypothetical protein